MSLELIHNYLHDSVQAYRACADALGVSSPALDILALIRVARSGDFNRRGELTTLGGVRYGYHIHGTGYTFTALASGRETRFDACVVGNNQCIRITVWNLLQYASSIGQVLTREAVQDAIQGPEATHLQLVHVTEGGSDFYCYPVSAAEK